MPEHIRNPIEWGADQLKLAALTIGSLGRSVRGSEESRSASLPAIRRINSADLMDVLVRGFSDFEAYRSDVIFLCLIYPIIGLVLVWLTFGYEMLPLVFPLVAGFALVGPAAAVGLYEMSRQDLAQKTRRGQRGAGNRSSGSGDRSANLQGIRRGDVTTANRHPPQP
jgi:hypothetical protein